MSRPGSRRGGSGKKAAPKNPKKVIAELTEQNEQLTQELSLLREEHAKLQERTDSLITKIVGGVNKKELALIGITEATDLRQLSTEVLLDLLSKLIVRKRLQEVSTEARVEDLETRVTEMSMDLAKMTKKTVAYEMGLEQIASSDDIDRIKDKVYELQLIAGKAYHSFAAAELLQPPEQKMNGVDEKIDSATRKTLENALKLNLIPPQRKFPGETHIRNMHKDLKLYIMKELSIEKASGADWRMFAERIGMDCDIIDKLESMKLNCPMGRVFAEWGQSPAASVRLLHRHLMSPQMRCTILGKRVCDFYDVD